MSSTPRRRRRPNGRRGLLDVPGPFQPGSRWSERQVEEMERESEPMAVDEFMARNGKEGYWPQED